MEEEEEVERGAHADLDSFPEYLPRLICAHDVRSRRDDALFARALQLVTPLKVDHALLNMHKRGKKHAKQWMQMKRTKQTSTRACERKNGPHV